MVKPPSAGPATAAKEEDNEEEAAPLTFESLFVAYSNFGPNSDEENVDGILLSQVDLWLKQAKLLGEVMTMTDTGVLFNKFRKRRITIEEFDTFLEILCEVKKLSKTDVKEKLFNAGMPTLAPKIS